MKHYLDLIPISARVHKKQNRMSVFCIVLAVFLVTTIFGMADMFIQSQILQAQKEYGNWHILLKDISDEDAAVMSARSDIAVVSPYAVLNYEGEEGYMMGEKPVMICGSDADWLNKIFPDMMLEGTFPENENEALISENALTDMQLAVGDSVAVQLPEGESVDYRISGVIDETATLMRKDAYGLFLNMAACCALDTDLEADGRVYYVQFADTKNIRQDMIRLQEAFGLSDDQISSNNQLLGLLGQSRDSFMMQIYATAAVLFVLVLVSGILMIASSLNSNVAQRTVFFGLLRCIGATPRQIMRLVRAQALRWCRFAIPAGVLMGVFVIWILCAILRFLSPQFFGELPPLGISVPSVAAGVIVGLLTVLLAARSPAKRAARVSPLTAVLGNEGGSQPVKKAANTRVFKIETALGIHHAKAGRKNLFLMTGSFALSIILFLSFSVTVDFMSHALTPLKPWTPDLSIISPDDTCSVDRDLLDALGSNPAVKSVYGRMFAYNVPVIVNDSETTVDLLSYEEHQFRWAGDYLLEGSVDTVAGETGTGMIVYSPENPLHLGDTVLVNINGQPSEIRIEGILSDSPFDSTAESDLIICSEATLGQLTDASDYTILDIQLNRSATDGDVEAIRQMAGPELTFSDNRLSNRSVKGTYYCFGLFVYGFLVLIALITIFNIINSLAMSAAARTRQYGVFRAIGLGTDQMRRMIIAEAATYTVAGGIVGTVLGLVCNWGLFGMLVGYRWGDPWRVPWVELAIILAIILLSAALAVQGPIKRLRQMSIVENISAE